MNETLLTATDIANLLQGTVIAVDRLLENRDMPAPIKVAGLIRWKQSDITRWINRGCPTQEKIMEDIMRDNALKAAEQPLSD